MASVTVNLTGYGEFGVNAIRWPDNVSLGTTFDDAGAEQTLGLLFINYRGTQAGLISIDLIEVDSRFTPAFEATGRIIFEASDGETLEVMIANADMTEPYNWTPANSAEVIAFANHVRGLTDQDATLTLTDDPVTEAPAFVDDTGDVQNWTQNQAITDIIVPEATGVPIPTYAVQGLLPDGILFNVNTRILSGTPTTVGSGTITIRATNEGGMDDWAVDYNIVAQLVVPSFIDNTGDDQSWTQNQDINDITVPIANGNPIPTYAVFGSLPAGINFDSDTRIIFGVPTNVGSGTITIRATNSEGIDDWTIDYVTGAALVAPSFTDNTGDNQAWIQGTAINNITVPEASGNPTPTYMVVGNLPNGINFNVVNRVISGSPTVIGSGTITIRATNTEGINDWTVNYATAAALTIPLFADDTGDSQTWTVGTTIGSITVPTASGNPIPTYAVMGSLPDGINFNINTRVISGTPTATGSGTITIRADNSEGSDDWTIDYITSTGFVIPTFVDDTGDPQSWTQNVAISPITVPEATGTPTITYSVIGSLPSGILFDPSTRIISGIPTEIDNNTITIRATNTGGVDDWTVGYSTVLPLGTISQTIVNASAATFSGFKWFWNSSSDTGANWLFNSAFIDGDTASYFDFIRFNPDGLVGLDISFAGGLGGSDEPGPELVALFESDGVITITAGSNVLTLNGIGDTTEPYEWTPTDSQASFGGLTGAAAVAAFYTASLNISLANVTFSFDGISNTAPTVSISATPLTVDADETVTLDATVNDTEDDITDLTLLWSTSNGGVFGDTSVGDNTWVAPVLRIGETVTLTLTVTDTEGLSSSDSVDIVVRAGTLEAARMTILADDDANKWYSIFVQSGVTEDIGSFTGDAILYDDTVNDFVIDRVWWVNNANKDFRINRNPPNVAYGTPADINTYFGTGGIGEDYSFFVLIGGTIVEIPASQRRSIGPHYINLTVDDDDVALFNSVSVGDTIVVAVGFNIDLATAIEYGAFGVTIQPIILSGGSLSITALPPIQYNASGVVIESIALSGGALDIIPPATIEYNVAGVTIQPIILSGGALNVSSLDLLIEYNATGVTISPITLSGGALDLIPIITIEYGAFGVTIEPITLSGGVLNIIPPAQISYNASGVTITPIELSGGLLQIVVLVFDIIEYDADGVFISPISFSGGGLSIASLVLTGRQIVNTRERMLDYLPRFYSDGQVMNNLFEAIAPELENLREYLVTPDSSERNFNKDLQELFEHYFDNEVGWGHERFINQLFIISTNHLFGEYSRLYGTIIENNYIRLRDKLLFYSSLNRIFNEFVIRQELSHIGTDILNNIMQMYANYALTITLNSIGDQETLAILGRRFVDHFPAHLAINLVSEFMTLDDVPQGTLDDVIPNVLV